NQFCDSLAIKKPSNGLSEAELVEVWSYVINALAGHSLTLWSGELTSKATKWQQTILRKELDIDSGSAAYGRKLDLQCHIDGLELNNSEFKTGARSQEQVEIQYRKNLRVNQAMMLYLQDQIGFRLEDLEVLTLDVHGHSAVLVSLRYENNIFVTDLATSHLLRLPDSTIAWKHFLLGGTLTVLIKYVEHLADLIDRIDEQSFLHEQQVRTGDRTTPERESRGFSDFTFFSPIKKRTHELQPNTGSLRVDEDSDLCDSDASFEYDD
ncbi:hypothetical protein BGX21_004778, partial [Mortierella sp. AD011]